VIEADEQIAPTTEQHHDSEARCTPTASNTPVVIKDEQCARSTHQDVPSRFPEERAPHRHTWEVQPTKQGITPRVPDNVPTRFHPRVPEDTALHQNTRGTHALMLKNASPRFHPRVPEDTAQNLQTWLSTERQQTKQAITPRVTDNVSPRFHLRVPEDTAQHQHTRDIHAFKLENASPRFHPRVPEDTA
jgi:hypothetical protein